MLLLNWSAPAAIGQKAQEQQGLAFTQTVCASGSNLGILLCPVFHYKRHQKHMLEHVLLKSLASRGVDVDDPAMLLFRKRADLRDNRPLVYPMRIVKPVTAEEVQDDSDMDDAEPNKKKPRRNARAAPGMAGFWANSTLSTCGRTQEAEQVPNAKLKMAEDLSDAALPTTVDETSTPRGGKRFEQIGVDAATKLLDAILESDVQVPDNIGGILLVDLSVGVGDFFRAWLKKVNTMRCPLLYVGATASPSDAEWLQHVTVEEVGSQVLAGELVLPGFTPKPSDPPSDLVLAEPPLPTFNLCVGKGGSLVVAPAQVQIWGAHAKFGPEFQDKLKAIVDEFGEPAPESQTGPAAAAAGGNSEPSPKKPRTIPPLDLLQISDLPDTKLAECAVAGLKKELSGKVILRIAQDQSWLVLNPSQSALNLPAGTVLAGFGQGSFKHIPRTADGKPGVKPEGEKLILFDLQDSASSVLQAGKLTTVGALVAGCQAARPQAEVCYHKMINESSAGLSSPPDDEDPLEDELGGASGGGPDPIRAASVARSLNKGTRGASNL